MTTFIRSSHHDPSVNPSFTMSNKLKGKFVCVEFLKFTAVLKPIIERKKETGDLASCTLHDQYKVCNSKPPTVQNTVRQSSNFALTKKQQLHAWRGLDSGHQSDNIYLF